MTKDLDNERDAAYSSFKLRGIAHLMSNYRRACDDSHEESEAWSGISLILEDIADDIYEVSQRLERQDKIAAKELVSKMHSK